MIKRGRLGVSLGIAALAILLLADPRASLPVGAAPGRYRFEELLPLPGNAHSAAGDPVRGTSGCLNDRGSVVGVSYDRSPEGEIVERRAVLWRGQTPDELPIPQGFSQTVAHAVNERGQIAGVGETVDGFRRALLWEGEVPTELPLLPGGAESAAYGIAPDGTVVGEATEAGGYARAVAWRDGEAHPLRNISGESYSFAAAAARGGFVAGGSLRLTSAGETITGRALLWRHDRRFELQNARGGAASRASDVNDRGEVVGQAQLADGSARAARWRRGFFTDLGTLPGLDHSRAVASNNRGHVVGVAYNQPGPDEIDRRAVLWRGRRGTDLNTMLPFDTVWTLRQAVGINNRGQIACNGSAGGNERAFLMTPR